ncbi:hypothetical protein [Aquimarina litoralis]|uniref:hypothetical protein n=1 Tax=Aquimarina litoralis TaxID=584605 RepID=UPI001C56D235|nr:hypothetical protein [Aquimarina litoralis]MBW1296440.1 hypothetical protein [Aquimarina litoralis]
MLELGKHYYRTVIIQGDGDGTGNAIKKKPKEIILADIQTDNDEPTMAELAAAINASPRFTVAEDEFPVFTISSTKRPPV